MSGSHGVRVAGVEIHVEIQPAFAATARQDRAFVVAVDAVQCPVVSYLGQAVASIECIFVRGHAASGVTGDSEGLMGC